MGDESLCNYLRVCVSIELYLEGNYYVEHPYTVSKQLSIPQHANYVFSMSLSNEATFELQNSHESKLLCIKRQAFTAKEWGSLVSVLALSNVVDSQIMSIYPASGTDYDTIMNEVIIPRRGTGGMLHILWPRTTSLATQSGPF